MLLAFFVLFLALSPGVLFTIPPLGKKMGGKLMTAAMHAVLFVIVVRLLYGVREGFQKTVTRKGPVTPFKEHTIVARCTAPVGHYCDLDSVTTLNIIKKCEPGSFTSEFGLETCEGCPHGSISNPEQTGCITCEPGTTSIRGTRCEPCPAGTYSDISIEGCKKCPYGKSSQPGSTVCVDSGGAPEQEIKCGSDMPPCPVGLRCISGVCTSARAAPRRASVPPTMRAPARR